jgi:ankyrin repeat protein
MKSRHQDKLNHDLLGAINSQNFELALNVIERGAELNQEALSWTTPLSQAIMMMFNEEGINFVHKLLALGANVNPENSSTTPLASAIQMNWDGSKDWLIDLLLEKGAEVNPKSNNITVTPLSVAVQNNNSSMVNKLLALGADVNPSNESLTGTPFTAAVNMRNHEIMAVILEKTDFTKKLPVKINSTHLMLAFNVGDQV